VGTTSIHITSGKNKENVVFDEELQSCKFAWVMNEPFVCCAYFTAKEVFHKTSVCKEAEVWSLVRASCFVTTSGMPPVLSLQTYIAGQK
jgi:hypothetical protein